MHNEKTRVANRVGVYESIRPRETNIYEGAIHLREFRVVRSQDPQREGHGHGGMKSGMGRAEWEDVWAIDEQVGLPVGAGFKYRSYDYPSCVLM